MGGDQGGWVGQFVVPPHPEGEEDDGGEAHDGNQRVQHGAEELRLLGEGVGGGCGAGKQKNSVSFHLDRPDIEDQRSAAGLADASRAGA